MNVVVTPPAVTLSVGDSTTLTAQVSGSSNIAVTWQVQENNGGAVTDRGIYTAPAVPGVYHVTAASQADPTREATVTITVQSGNAAGVIQ